MTAFPRNSAPIGIGWFRFCPLLLLGVFGLGSSLRAQVVDAMLDFNLARYYDELEVMKAGAAPVASLTRGSDGNFYGTTTAGGSQFGDGTVFRITPGGEYTTLYNFDYSVNPYTAYSPAGPITQGYDGFLYGTGTFGGHSPTGNGVVFKLSPNGAYTPLAEFDGYGTGNKGNHPKGRLVLDPDGNLFGTTTQGGSFSNGRGTIFKINPDGVLTTLVDFSGTSGAYKGDFPSSELLLEEDGTLYGTTEQGGVSNEGTVFKLSPDGTFTTLVEFTGVGGGAKGSSPRGLTRASDGNFYGVTLYGGAEGFGTIFRMTPSGTLTTLVEFTAALDISFGKYPTGIIEASDGNFYGTTEFGGANNEGTIFKMTSDGDLTTLVEFTGNVGDKVGRAPKGSLAEGLDGNLYGVTEQYGENDGGTIFRVSPSGDFTTLYNLGPPFRSSLGLSAVPGLALGEDGAFYGATELGGIHESGTVYRMTPGGDIRTVASFDPDELTGQSQQPGPVTKGADGRIYGTTLRGGSVGLGTIYRADPETNTMTVLGEFTGTGGAQPGSKPVGLTLGNNGDLYGTTRFGGGGDLGTVFKVTEEGLFTTLVEFTGDAGPLKGSQPVALLLLASDGDFYGTTSAGGTFGFGTIFRMTHAGVLTTLIEFTGNGVENQGASPHGLMQASDGNFYGSTTGGGNNGWGTYFRLDSNGVLTTLAHATSSTRSFSTLAQGIDGNFYTGGLKLTPEGTLSGAGSNPIPSYLASMPALTAGGDGDLYGAAGNTFARFFFPGPPLVFPSEAVLISNSAVSLSAKVHPRGMATTATVEYGTDGISFPGSLTLASALTGNATERVGNKLIGLSPGTTYHYRIRATNSEGATLSEVMSFTTLPGPLPVALPATELTRTGALLRGTVNGRGLDSAVRFEWGSDGNSFPNSVAANPPSVTGEMDVAVSASVAGLTKGTTYHYRIVASSIGGTTVSGSRSFRTLTEPVASIGGSFALTTTSVRVEGSVDAEGSDTTVVFEYGTDGVNYPSSVSATPGTVTGFGSRAVSAVLPNLTQGVTYHYRIKASSEGGDGYSADGSFSMNVLSGFTRVFPGAAPEALGFVLVNLSPPGLLHGWRFVGERRWRPSGVPAGGLTTGDREIEFRPVPGRIHPPTETVTILSGEAATVLDRTYFETGAVGSGGLSVRLKPDSITTGEGRAQWRLLGEDDNAWRDSGVPISGLAPAAYLVECKPVAGRATPPNANVLVSEGQTASPTLTYFLATTGSGQVPAVQAFETVTSGGDQPFAFVGQIRSNAGLSSGFVVKERVVATAAHVVWDEGTLAAAEGLQWLHQRHRGTYEPEPLTPRGFYLLSGYADQRELEDSPGSFSPESRNLDVAAMYFNQDAGRGGYGGFLASDLDDNEFLLSDANKLLVGYPVDDFASATEGRMHATTPFNVAFTPVGPSADRTFFTTDIRSSGGNSGGPLCVQFEGGPYYPAAIYLGGTEQSLVRAIDSDVLDLFNRAELSGIDDQPHTGGGITHTSVTSIGASSDPGALAVTLLPASAAGSGGWRLRPENTYRNSGAQAAGLNAGRYVLELRSVDGFQTPAAQSVTIRGGQLKSLTFTYALPPVPDAEITLTGNGRDIADGDPSPSAADHTDFGVVAVGGGTLTRTFTIANTGSTDLSVGSPGLGGAHAEDFSVSVLPGASVPPGSSTTFEITFAPTAGGTRSASVSFVTGDLDENPFDFTIQGNDTTDSDSNGFSNVEEAALLELLGSLTVGDTVDIDLGFLRLEALQVLAVTGLPPGLGFDPSTRRITGTVTGKADGSPAEIRKVLAETPVATLPYSLAVFNPASLTLGGLRGFPTTRVGRRSRPQTLTLTNSGERDLTAIRLLVQGGARREFLAGRPATSILTPSDSTTAKVIFKPRARGSRRATLLITSNTTPRSITLSGKGR